MTWTGPAWRETLWHEVDLNFLSHITATYLLTQTPYSVSDFYDFHVAWMMGGEL